MFNSHRIRFQKTWALMELTVLTDILVKSFGDT